MPAWPRVRRPPEAAVFQEAHHVMPAAWVVPGTCIGWSFAPRCSHRARRSAACRPEWTDAAALPSDRRRRCKRRCGAGSVSAVNATGSDAYRFAIPSISMVVLTATPPDDTSRTPPSLTMVSLARPPELTASVPPSVTVGTEGDAPSRDRCETVAYRGDAGPAARHRQIATCFGGGDGCATGGNQYVAAGDGRGVDDPTRSDIGKVVVGYDKSATRLVIRDVVVCHRLVPPVHFMRKSRWIPGVRRERRHVSNCRNHLFRRDQSRAFELPRGAGVPRTPQEVLVVEQHPRVVPAGIIGRMGEAADHHDRRPRRPGEPGQATAQPDEERSVLQPAGALDQRCLRRASYTEMLATVV